MSTNIINIKFDKRHFGLTYVVDFSNSLNKEIKRFSENKKYYIVVFSSKRKYNNIKKINEGYITYLIGY